MILSDPSNVDTHCCMLFSKSLSIMFWHLLKALIRHWELR